MIDLPRVRLDQELSCVTPTDVILDKVAGRTAEGISLVMSYIQLTLSNTPIKEYLMAAIA
mgnify:CR=1 FL=1